MNTNNNSHQFKNLNLEYLLIAEYTMSGWERIWGLCAGEYKVATQCFIEATFVGLVIKTIDVICGLLKANTLTI